MVPVLNESSHFSELVSYSRPMLTAAGIITLIIMIIGVAGNSLTVIALIRHSKMRTVAAAFIASLCVSDLLLGFIVLPFGASQFFHGIWIHGDVLCILIPLMRYGGVGVSLLSICTISINRYILIAWPQLYPRLFTRINVGIYIGIIWLISYGLQLPTLIGIWGKFGFDEKLGTCTITPDKNGRTSKTALFVIAFAIPCIIIVMCYTRIYWIVRKSHQRVQQHISTTKTKRSEMNITKMVVVIFLCFVVCYLPLTIVKVFDKNVIHPPLHVLGYLLLYFASCVNPVVYVTMNKQYRRAYLNTLSCNYSKSLDSNSPGQIHSKTMSVMFAKNVINPKS